MLITKLPKTINLFYLMLFALSSVSNTALSQQLEKGTKKIDFYYGCPSIWNSIKASEIRDETGEYFTNKSNLGAFGIRLETILFTNFGIGAEFNYASSTIEWKEHRNYLEDGVTKSKYFKYKDTFNRWRALLRANYYYYTSPKHHAYMTGGFGYANYHYKIEKESLAPLSQSEDDDEYLPITFRLGIGDNFYITKFFALSMEIGTPGPLLMLGGTLKF